MSSPATVAAVMAGNDARAAIMWAVFGIPILQNIYFVYNSDSLSYDRVAFLLWMIPLYAFMLLDRLYLSGDRRDPEHER